MIKMALLCVMCSRVLLCMLVSMHLRILCRNIVRDEEAAKLCDELKAMRDLHEQQKEVAILI